MTIKNVFPVVFAMLMILSACSGTQYLADGDINAIGPGTAFRLVADAVHGKSGVYVMNMKNLYMFVKPVNGGSYFVVLDTVNREALKDLSALHFKGNCVNCNTMTELKKFLETSGWKSIPTSAIPPIIRQAVISGNSWLTNLSTSLTTFILVPTGIFVMPKGYEPEIQ